MLLMIDWRMSLSLLMTGSSFSFYHMENDSAGLSIMNCEFQVQEKFKLYDILSSLTKRYVLFFDSELVKKRK